MGKIYFDELANCIKDIIEDEGMRIDDLSINVLLQYLYKNKDSFIKF